jgi:hypothetical protein
LKEAHPYMQEDLARIIGATRMKTASLDLQEFSKE